uniref:Uncharacterized protein n=1 Tax=Picea glauca TaxID=3330 RepID=A0A101LWZ7_PICGL|nr:hypothetical protein ABT39_MTgene6330 [Picea glauca]QHR87037.1 hypothetical protein Q903MT_gene1046 [Picea sitchensis]
MPTLISLLGQGGTLDEVLLRLNQLELDRLKLVIILREKLQLLPSIPMP